MKTMPLKPQYLRATIQGRPVKVDREAEILYGYVVAQEGPFKSEGRGEFDGKSLQAIMKLGNAARGGLKARFTHPDMSSDGLGKFLGRAQQFSMSTATDARTGDKVQAVRADLHFDKSAHDTPSGDLSGYVMTLAESDPSALSSSLVLQVQEEFRLKKDGTPETDEAGNPLPPLWRPTHLHATDIVDTGDAVDGLLSMPQLAGESLQWDNLVRLASKSLDDLFAGQTREVVEARCRDYLQRYLNRRYGDIIPEPEVATPILDAMRERIGKLSEFVGKLKPVS